MEDFATYILEEKDLPQKMMIAYYLSKKAGIFFDKSIALKAEMTKIFIEYMKLDVDENLLLTVMLLCNCKKIENAQKLGKLETFAKDGAEYLSLLGFNRRFCKLCEEVNRYSGSTPREKESDLLEVVDQFTGLILNRIERSAFTPKEAIVILKEKNFKYIDNRYLGLFEEFVEDMENITIKENVEVPVIQKLVHLHNREPNVKTFIAALANRYNDKISEAIMSQTKKNAKKILETKEREDENRVIKTPTEKMEELVQTNKDQNRALFSEDIAKKVLNHEATYKVEEN